MTDYRKMITDSTVLEQLGVIDQAMTIAKERPNEPSRKESVRADILKQIATYQKMAQIQSKEMGARVQPVLAELKRLLAETDLIGKTPDDDEYQS